MLLASIHRKISASDVKKNEDALTSTVFGTLQYLPSSVFCSILKSAVDEHFPLSDAGQIESIEFWPNWDAIETTNKNFVEPDAFIRFSHGIDLIVEAKPFEVKQQDPAQWTNQIQAYKNEYSHEGKRLLYMAIGGLNIRTSERVGDQEIFKCYWKDLLKAIETELDSLTASVNYSDTKRRTSAILSNTVAGFSLFGYYLSTNVDGQIIGKNIAPNSLELWKTCLPKD